MNAVNRVIYRVQRFINEVRKFKQNVACFVSSSGGRGNRTNSVSSNHYYFQVSYQKPVSVASSTTNSEKIRDADSKSARDPTDERHCPQNYSALVQRCRFPGRCTLQDHLHPEIHILNTYYHIYVDYLKQYENPAVKAFKSFFEKDNREKRASGVPITVHKQQPVTSHIAENSPV